MSSKSTDGRPSTSSQPEASDASIGSAPQQHILTEQIDYYRERASEYDEWFFRQGRYDRGTAHRTAWLNEAAIVEAALREVLPEGDILELACGTGLWTRHLATGKRRVLAVDASPETIALNQARVRSDSVEYVVTDLFAWTPPPGSFDAVFFGFWLSHVPAERFEAFWHLVRTALKPTGIAFFVDSLLEQTSSAVNHPPVDESGIVLRRLNDGRSFRIVKVFYEPAVLQRQLTERGWRGWVRSTGTFFLYGSVAPASGGS